MYVCMGARWARGSAQYPKTPIFQQKIKNKKCMSSDPTLLNYPFFFFFTCITKIVPPNMTYFILIDFFRHGLFGIIHNWGRYGL